MADRDPGDEQPSLELPKLGRRRRRPRAAPALADTRPIAVDDVPQIVAEPTPAPTPPPTPAPTPGPARRARRDRGPGGMLAAIVTGLVVGLGIVGLTWASLQGCEQVHGTSSCGRAGYPLLGVILAAMVVVGALLLRLARVAEPGSTSFLGVGLASVIALLVLVDSLDDASMLVVIPLLSAACFAAARWVTSTFVDPPETDR